MADTQMTSQSMGLPIALTVGQATSVGQVRPANEDSLLCERADTPDAARRGLFCAVADGMGGHAAGDVASSIAVQSARDAYYASPSDAVDRALREAVAAANSAVYKAGAGARGRDHMGSTLTAAVIVGDQMVVGHVGDSRCYVVRDGSIRQLTRDHSWVAEAVEAGDLTAAEARVHPRRNIITRALGLGANVDVDLYVAPLTVGSVVVLCSDGLHGLVPDEEIGRYASSYAPQYAADELVALANERGGIDNITAVVIRVDASDASDDTETLTGLPRPDEQTAPLPTLTAEHLARAADLAHASPPPADSSPVDTSPPPDPAPMAIPRERSRPAASADIRRAPPASFEADVVPTVPELGRPRRRGIDLVVLLVVLLALALLGAAVGLSLVRTLGIG